jgi:flagellar motor protein MotB
VNEADFETLAASRARAVQAYLLQTGKVEPARIFVTVGGAESLRQDGSRTYLEFR